MSSVMLQPFPNVMTSITATVSTCTSHFLIKRIKVMGRLTNCKTTFLLLMLGCKSFAVNYSLKSGMHRHHQILGFIPGDALPDLYCKCLQFLLLLGAVFFSVFSSTSEINAQLDSCQVIDSCTLSTCTVSHRPMSSEAEYEQIMCPETLQNSSCCFCQESHHQ